MILADAIEWCEYSVKRRYEWAEIIQRMLGGGSAGSHSAEAKFCQACKAAKRNKDCKKCSRKIEVVKKQGK